MTTNETCPHCGAERKRSARKSVVEFECGAVCFKDGTYVRDWVCYERQLAAQAAEIERLKKEASEAVQILREISFLLPFLKR